VAGRLGTVDDCRGSWSLCLGKTICGNGSHATMGRAVRTGYWALSGVAAAKPVGVGDVFGKRNVGNARDVIPELCLNGGFDKPSSYFLRSPARGEKYTQHSQGKKKKKKKKKKKQQRKRAS